MRFLLQELRASVKVRRRRSHLRLHKCFIDPEYMSVWRTINELGLHRLHGGSTILLHATMKGSSVPLIASGAREDRIYRDVIVLLHVRL